MICQNKEKEEDEKMTKLIREFLTMNQSMTRAIIHVRTIRENPFADA